MKTIKVRLEFNEELLGTASANPDIHSDYIASLAPDAESRAEEVASVGAAEVTEKAMTIFPRNENGQPILYDQRPLRASTAQGERIALANSEAAPAGTWIEFDVKCYTDTMYDAVYEWLDYGEDRGIGQ